MNNLVLVLAGFLFSINAFAELSEVKNFGKNPGSLKMFVYTPKNVKKSAPLVVLLHGCAQSAKQYDDETGFVHMAEKTGAVLLLPEQSSSNNIQSCFNWFEPGDITRGKGEAASIINMVNHLQEKKIASKKRVFISGLSAGGAMSAVMLANYPDKFAGGGLVAGVPFGCARSMFAGFTCMRSVNKTPEQWTSLVKKAFEHRGSYPKVIIFQGTSDPFVSPKNANELLEQWGGLHKASNEELVLDNNKLVHKTYKNSKGQSKVDVVMLKGMSHGHPIDMSSGCGSSGQWVIDHGVCAAEMMSKFFNLKR